MWHHKTFCKNEHPNQLSQTMLFITFAFRAFCAAVVMSFTWERSHDPLTTILGGAIVLTAVVLDFFFTVRRFWECEQHAWMVTCGIVLKILLIAVVLSYTLSIWLRISYWAYPVFGLLIALLMAFDFIFVAHNKK